MNYSFICKAVTIDQKALSRYIVFVVYVHTLLQTHLFDLGKLLAAAAYVIVADLIQ